MMYARIRFIIILAAFASETAMTFTFGRFVLVDAVSSIKTAIISHGVEPSVVNIRCDSIIIVKGSWTLTKIVVGRKDNVGSRKSRVIKRGCG